MPTLRHFLLDRVPGYREFHDLRPGLGESGPRQS
jgi:hypothetical protein